jgi:hypothetical protein
MSKKFWQSRTLWIAVLQGAIGIYAAVVATSPEIQAIGVVAILKGAADAALRIITVAPIE